MILSEISIRRPVFAMMLNVVLIVFGLFSLPRLPIDQYPNVDFPVVTVTVVYPGADPASVEQRVLKPLEKAVNGISGLDKLASTAYRSVAQIVLQFVLEKNSDQAAQEVRDKIFAALADIPKEAQTPIVQKFDIGGAPIMNISLTGESIPYGQLSQIAKDVVVPSLERVTGVAAVNTAGIREREVQIFVDRARLASFGLSPSDIVQSIQLQNLDYPAGKVQNDKNYWTVRVKGRLANGDEIAQLPILSGNNSNLRISDVASVQDVIAEEETASFVDKTPTILMNLQKQSGTNTPQVASQARVAIEKLKSKLPEGARLEIVSDNTVYIKGSIDGVKLDLWLGALLATFIVLIFLRNLRVTLISATALPTAVIATFAFLHAMGFSLNMMSTLGLSLSIGILIDDAIIVIENIFRHRAMGKGPALAAKDATSEIGLAVFATTLTIGSVFVPVAFMEGIIGRFFYQFGLTVTFAVMVSLFVAFTLTPMLAARFLQDGEEEPKNPTLNKLWHKLEHAFVWMDKSYKAILQWCLHHRGLTLMAGLFTFILSFVLLRFVPVSFFPKEDKSQFQISYTLPEGTTLDRAKIRALEMSERLRAYPGVEKVITAIANNNEKKPNKANLDILLIDKEKRSYTQFQLMDRVRKEMVPDFIADGSEVIISESGQNNGGGRTQTIQLIFKSDDWDKLIAFTEQLAQFIRENIPEAVDISTSKPKTQKEYRVAVDPGRAADLGVSTAQVGNVVWSLFQGDKISEFEDKGVTHDVRLRISDKDRVDAQDIAALQLPNRRGQLVSLGAIAHISEADSPSMIERMDGQRQVAVLANFTGKDLNAASTKIQGFVDKNMPSNMSMILAGQTDIMKKSIASILQAMLLAILLVFMILCAQYERFLAPMVIMAALPLSLTGAFGSLLITGQMMSIYTMIGIILLMGIVTKNGILLVDFALQRIRAGLSVDEALLEAGPIRLRPILMTTFAAGGGMIPIAIGHGAGGEARSPMGVAVIGGLLMSTLLTLVIVPCLFSVVEQGMERLRSRRKGSHDSNDEAMEKQLTS